MNNKLFFTLLTFCYFYFFPMHEKVNNPNEVVRVYMTRSIVEFNTFAIGKRVKLGSGFKDTGYVHQLWGYVNDRALVCFDKTKKPPNCEGLLYAAKAPGTSMLGVPFYFLLKLIKKNPSKTQTIFWLRFFTIQIPAILFLWLFYLFVADRWKNKNISQLSVVFLATGTMFFTYQSMFAGHILAAIFLFSAFIFTFYANKYPKAHFLYASGVGFFLSLATITEYPSAIGAIIIAISFLLKSKQKTNDILALITGAFLPAFAGAIFHYKAFGSIFKTPYMFLENPVFIKDIAPGFMGLTLPKFQRFIGSFFSPYAGMFYFTPLFLFVFTAPVFLTKKNIVENKGIFTTLTIIIAYILFISSHSLWRGGWQVGPRYILMSVPFFTYYVFSFFKQYENKLPIIIKVIFFSLLIISVFNRVLSYTNSQGYPFEFYNSLYEFSFFLFKKGYLFFNLLNIAGVRGILSALPFLTIIVFLLLFPVIKNLSQKKDFIMVLLSILFITIGGVFFQSAFSKPINKQRSDSLRFFIREWKPKDQGYPSRLLIELKKKKSLSKKEKILKINLTSGLKK